jgi:hypothetical protein
LNRIPYLPGTSPRDPARLRGIPEQYNEWRRRRVAGRFVGPVVQIV